MTAMVKNIRRDEYEGLVLPYGYTFELTSTGGSRQFDTNKIIERYDTRIAMTVLADFLMLGHQQVGSFALSSNKTEMFGTAIGAFLDIICETFNKKGIPDLININGEHFNGITDYPQMTHGQIEDVDIDQMSKYLQTMVGTGIIVPDGDLEDYVRDIANLPKRAETEQNAPEDSRRQKPEEVQPEDNEPTDEQVEEAKARLGR